MKTYLPDLIKRSLDDGMRFKTVKNVNPKLKIKLFWHAWADFRGLVSWPQFFVFYVIYFKEAQNRDV